MALTTLFKRKAADLAEPPMDDAAVVQRARTSARRRLIGAAVLLGVGVIGFPLLFETQPRPIPVDIPIDIPRKEAVAPLVLPAKPRVAGAVVSEPLAEPPVAASVAGTVTLPVPQLAAPAATAAPAAPTAATTSAPAALAPVVASAPAANPKQPVKENARLIIQVGAFADVASARKVRAQVEKLGLKTYTQVIETDEGRRIRVRVGPFSSRADADKAAAKLRGASLPAAVRSL